jgi:hypothetical protein
MNKGKQGPCPDLAGKIQEKQALQTARKIRSKITIFKNRVIYTSNFSFALSPYGEINSVGIPIRKQLHANENLILLVHSRSRSYGIGNSSS